MAITSTSTNNTSSTITSTTTTATAMVNTTAHICRLDLIYMAMHLVFDYNMSVFYSIDCYWILHCVISISV